MEIEITDSIEKKRIEMPCVLIVDDERDIADLVGKMLSTHNYCCFTANSFDEAYDIFNKNKDMITLALLDFYLHGLKSDKTGKALLHAMKPIKPGIKAIYMSGCHSLEKNDLAEEGVYNKILQKPFKMADVVKYVNDALRNAA